MLTRIVKMTFKEEETQNFLNVFEQRKNQIASFEGCKGVELLRDISNPNIFFTYSKWETETYLETYRNSALFGEVWKTVKKMFSEKAEAWSVTEVWPSSVSTVINVTFFF